ncbi:MAG: hypothetical protein QOJ64_3805 [Acidobacteriota bacterium]|jgi:hypothetical protein|nr:hypothetical protein [Acidobacteriota bacterium]
MNLTDIHEKLVGNWSGTNLLRLSWVDPPDYNSSTNLSVVPVAKAKFLSFSYTWSHEDVAQEGLLIVGYDNKLAQATAGYIDSWHMSGKVMPFTGTINDQGVIDLLGSYEAPPGPDWGWRIVIKPSDGALQMLMYNIPPDGEEDLAVDAKYKRLP